LHAESVSGAGGDAGRHLLRNLLDAARGKEKPVSA
jgi:hypothetical protein